METQTQTETQAADPAAQQTAQQQAGQTAEQTAEQRTAEGQDNSEAAKWRRLAEKHEKNATAAAAKLKAIEDAALSESEKVAQRAKDLETENKALKTDLLRRKIAQEEGLGADAFEFLSGEDEDTIRAKAGQLKTLIGTGAAASGTGSGTGTTSAAGTTTNPGSAQKPNIDDSIAAARKAGNVLLTIALERQKQGWQ